MNVCRFKLPRSCVAWLQQPQETDPGPSTSQGSPRARHHPGHRASQQLAALAGEQRRDLHHLTPKPSLYSRSLCDSHRNPRQRTASLRIRGPSPSRPAGGSPLEAEVSQDTSVGSRCECRLGHTTRAQPGLSLHSLDSPSPGPAAAGWDPSVQLALGLGPARDEPEDTPRREARYNFSTVITGMEHRAASSVLSSSFVGLWENKIERRSSCLWLRCYLYYHALQSLALIIHKSRILVHWLPDLSFKCLFLSNIQIFLLNIYRCLLNI